MAYWNKNKIVFNHNPLLPQKCLRCLIIGSSGCGKTSLLLKMITEDYFDFNRIVFASASIFQDEYQILIDSYKYGLKNKYIRKLFENQDEVNDYKKAIPIIARQIPDHDKVHIEVIIYEDSNDIPPPEKLKKEGSKTLVIIDDMLTKDQTQISELFVYGRPCNMSVIYLSQSYFRLDRQTIRLNANFLILFKLNKHDIQNIYDDLCSVDFRSFDEFKIITKDVFKDKYSFLSINLDETDINKKYTRNFESPLINIMTRISADEYNSQLLKSYNAEKDLLKRIKESRNVSSAFQYRQAEVLKPVIEPLKKMEKDIAAELPKTLSDSRALVKVKNDEPEEKPPASDDVTMEKIIDMVNKGTDDVFGLVMYNSGDDTVFKFGVLETFEQIEDSKGEQLYLCGDHEITFDVELQMIEIMRTTVIRGGGRGPHDKRDFPLTHNVMLYLTKDISTTYVKGGQVDENAKAVYKDIIKFAIGRELEKVKKSKSPRRAELVELFRKNQKFKDVLAPVYLYKGDGYKAMAMKPVVISPDKSEQFKRLMILLGAKQAGNDSETGKAEYSAILDELLKNGVIDKKLYKLLYYKFTN